MIRDYLIIGGGVGGLAAANHLADHGEDVVLLEAGSYPTPKVCGEFCSPECLPLLDRWGIGGVQQISLVVLHVQDSQLKLTLPQAAGGFPRQDLELKLAQRCQRQGAELRTEVRVSAWQRDSEGHHVRVESGESFRARRVLCATGRVISQLTGYRPPSLPYIGFKAHLAQLDMGETLKMYALPGGYVGMSRVTPELTNLTGLVRADCLQRSGGIDAFLRANEQLATWASSAEGQWLTTPTPEFGTRRMPEWSETYCFGDAAGSIAPACGDGIAMALSSGILAADYARRGDAKGFRRAWRQAYLPRLRWGQLLHHSFLRPRLLGTLLPLGRLAPALPQWIFRQTRGRLTPAL